MLSPIETVPISLAEQKRSSTVLPELCSVVGEKCFVKVMDVFAGITVMFPSKSALEKLRKSREFLNRLSDTEQVFSPNSLGPGQSHL